MAILAARLNLATDQHAEFSRAWPLTYEATGDPVSGLDIASAELRTKGGEYVIPVDFDAFTVTLSFLALGSDMGTAGSFPYDVRIVPSTGVDYAWFLFYGTLLVRDRSDAP